ncbi:unnamed protein product [Mytilus edulis]|uniref:Reverse transcriptase domain-containing protein n=1 Tax=Mytilus edulis TaxID=6550 RepID=A0A8S3UCJ7_MYTED|nr:unnamed protein product [Mytilus edulis]
MYSKNNKSALEHSDFVSSAVKELVLGGLVKRVSIMPHVVNPLTVSVNGKGKHRLILDLRHVNKQVIVNKVKFEDWKTLSQYVTLNCYGYVFDLKAGYHHLNIFEQHQKYLGFSWKGEFYVFTVLPFGLSSSGYIFTKTVRQLVKHWRKSSIKVAVYLDDGFGVEVSYELCVKHARRIKADLIASGFVPNKDKCVWLPSQHVEWLGFSWNLISCKLQIPQRKIDDILNLVAFILNSSYRVKVRQLAKICGKLIALTPAVGNVTQIMTRNIFSVINIRDYWDQYVNIGKYPDCINELIFWRDNLPLLKAVDLKIFSTGFWKNDTQVKHTELKILFRKMKNSVIDSKARNTTVKYAYSFKRFVVWSEKYTEIKSVLPANEIYVSLYLQYLMQSAKHYSTIEAACYAIKWAHSLAGFEDPCASDIVKLTLHECSKSKVTLAVNMAAEGGIIYIQGQGSACLQTTTSTSRHYEFHFDICNITYGTVFRVIVQKYPTIQTGYDKVIPVICLADLSEIDLIEEVLPKKDDDVGVNITTKPVANLRVYTSSKTDISGGGVVNLNASIAMTITLADDFTGKEEVDVAFSCRLSVCKGKCDNTVCDKNVGYGRKRRDTKDNEIDEITCGTSIKVANRQKNHNLQESPVEPNTICVETLPAYFGLTIAGILFCLSWILSGYLLRQHLVNNTENKRMGVARAVGRRLTSMLNLPTGYDLKESKGFVTIPNSTDSTPPQRRKSVTVCCVTPFY